MANSELNYEAFFGLPEGHFERIFQKEFSKGMAEARLNFETNMLRIRQTVLGAVQADIEKMNLPDITHGSKKRVEAASDEELKVARVICSDPDFQDSRTEAGLKLVEAELARRGIK